MANRLYKKVIQMRLDTEPLAIQEFNNFMKNFIMKYTLKYVASQELVCKNINKREILVKLNNNVQNDSDNLDESSNYDSDYTQNHDDAENIDLFLIQNPIVHLKKGALRKTRFKRSQKIKQKQKTTLG